MSSILKALEKVEQSQTGRRSGGPAGLARSGKRSAPWILPVGILGGAAVAAMVTFAAMGGFSRHKAPASQQAAADAVTTPAAVAQSQVAPISASKAEKPKGAQQSAPAAAPVVAAKPEPATRVVAAPVTPAKVNAAPQVLGKSALSASASSPQAKPSPAKPVPAAVPQHAKPAAEHAKSASSGRVNSASHEHEKSVAARNEKVGRERHAKSEGERTSKRESQSVRQAQSRSVSPLPAAAQAAAPKPAPAPAPVAVAPPPAEEGPEVRVTGIAWQKDSHSSAAIINGRPVQQGGMVDGYKVEEIYEDKVLLSGKGRRLAIPLGGGE